MFNAEGTVTINIVTKSTKATQNALKETFSNLTGGMENVKSYTTDVTKGFFNQTRTITTYTKGAKGVIQVNEKIIKGGKQFKMEWLGIMFAGMGLSRAFGDFNKRGMETLGLTSYLETAFDTLSTMSLIGFTDSIVGAGDAIIDFATSNDAAAVAARGFIGSMTMIGESTGWVLGFAGQLILALSSLTMAFDDLGSYTGPIIGTLITGMATIFNSIKGMPAEFKAVGVGLGAIGGVLATTPLTKGMEGLPLSGAGKVATVAAGATLGAGISSLPIVDSIFNVSSIDAIKLKLTNGFKDYGLSLGVDFFDKDGKLKDMSVIYGELKAKGVDITGTDVEKKLQIMYENYYSMKDKEVKITFTGVLGGVLKGITSPGTIMLDLFGSLMKFMGVLPSAQFGGIVPGRFGEPVPIIAHGGERFMGTHGEYGGSSVVNFSPTYNITVSDAREFEAMIKANNDNVIRELKSMVI